MAHEHWDLVGDLNAGGNWECGVGDALDNVVGSGGREEISVREILERRERKEMLRWRLMKIGEVILDLRLKLPNFVAEISRSWGINDYIDGNNDIFRN